MKFLKQLTTILAGLLLFCNGLSAQNWNWVNRFGGPGTEFSTKQIIDPSGNVFTISSVTGSVNFGSGAINTNGSVDGLVTKHNSAGVLMWFTLLGGNLQDDINGISLDSSGNVYVCGKIQGTAIIGPDTLVCTTQDIFVAKLNASGQVLWGRKVGSSVVATELGTSIQYSAYDSTLVVTGYLRGTAMFGSYVVSNSGGFLAKMNLNGTWLWAYATTNNFLGFGQDIALDNTGCIYLSDTETAAMHVKKFTPTGTLIWNVGASATGGAGQIELDGFGNLFVVGYSSSAFSFGTLYYPPPLNLNGGFVIKMDTSGNTYWLRDLQSSSMYVSGLTFTPAGEIIISGMFQTTLYVDTTFFMDMYVDVQEGYVVKLSASGELIWFKQIGTTGQDHVYAVNYQAGSIYFSGIAGGTSNQSISPYSLGSGYGGLDVMMGKFGDCSPPTTTVSPSVPLVICEGDSIHLQSTTTSPAYTYQWQHNGVPFVGQTTPYLDIEADPLYSGAYAVQISSGGCYYTSPYISVTINPLPVVNTTTTHYNANCVKDSVRLTATNIPLHSYQWLYNGGVIGGATSSAYVADSSGTYHVVVTSPFGCIDTFSVSPTAITMGPYPVVAAWGDTLVCPGTQVPVEASGANNYVWSPSTFLNWTNSYSATSTPTASIVYMVVGTTLGCMDTGYVSVQVHTVTPPVISFNGYQLSSSGNYVSYQWNLNGLPVVGATSANYIPVTNGTYQVIVTDSNSCEIASNYIAVISTGSPMVEDQNSSLIVFPQPMSETAVVQLPFVASAGEVYLYDVAGKLLLQFTVQNQSELLLTKGDLTAGMYFLCVHADGVYFNNKIVIE